MTEFFSRVVFCLSVLLLDDTRLRFSSSRVAVTVGSLLDDQHWHSVIIERFNKQVNLTMDSQTQHFQTKGEGDSLEVDYEVSPSCQSLRLKNFFITMCGNEWEELF